MKMQLIFHSLKTTINDKNAKWNCLFFAPWSFCWRFKLLVLKFSKNFNISFLKLLLQTLFFSRNTSNLYAFAGVFTQDNSFWVSNCKINAKQALSNWRLSPFQHNKADKPFWLRVRMLQWLPRSEVIWSKQTWPSCMWP